MKQENQGKKSTRLPVILVVAWALIAILFGYSLWSDKAAEDNSGDFSETIATSAEPANVNTANTVANMTEEQRNQAAIRDSIRLSHMKILRSALESYRADNENYPLLIENLLPDYLEYLPQNPLPGGSTYVYTGIGSEPYQYYDLAYTLEVGAEGIDAGTHIASPNGLATP